MYSIQTYLIGAKLCIDVYGIKQGDNICLWPTLDGFNDAFIELQGSQVGRFGLCMLCHHAAQDRQPLSCFLFTA